MTRLVLFVACFLALLSFGAKPTDHRRVLYVRNTSSLKAERVREALPAFQRAVSHDFAPVWGQDVRLVYIGRNFAPKHGWVITLQDMSNCICYGYHDYQGKPVGFVDVGESKSQWDLVFTHELFELLADPTVNRAAVDQVSSDTWMTEVADPVEDDWYTIGGWQISDFVTPAWYGGYGRYDFLGRVDRPYQILLGGYACRLVYGQWDCAFNAG